MSSRRTERRDRRGNRGRGSRCIEESSGSGGRCGEHFIEFVTADDRVHGFAYSQLMNYTLEQIADSEHKVDAPEDRLQLFFSTADVTLTGWRLGKICDDLRDGRLLAVRTLPERYTNLDRNKPHVISITVRPIKPLE